MWRKMKDRISFQCSYMRRLSIKQFLLIVGLSWYAVICFLVEQPRPHCASPIGTNPHTFTLVSPEAFPSEIKGNVITLKKMKQADFEPFFEMFSDQVRKMFSFSDETKTDAWKKSFFEYELWRQKQGEMLYYCIYDNAENRLVGGIDIRAFWRHDPGMIGFWINEKYYGSGRMHEATNLLVEKYLEVMDIPVINAYVEPFNQRSFAACKKFGFEFIGFSQKGSERFFYVLERYRK